MEYEERTENVHGDFGTSTFLPPAAANALVRAYVEAKECFPDSEFDRAKRISREVKKVKAEYPDYFVKDLSVSAGFWGIKPTDKNVERARAITARVESGEG